MGSRLSPMTVEIVLDMHFEEKKSYAEIAEYLGFSRSKVAGIVSRHRADGFEKVKRNTQSADAIKAYLSRHKK